MHTHKKDNTFQAWQAARYAGADDNNKLIINLRDLSHTMRTLYEGRGSQKRILIVLLEAGGSLTQRELTLRLGIQPGSVSEILAKLENAGQISRTPNRNDRRAMDVSLTSAGRETAGKALDQRILRHEEMFSCLSDSEKALLLSLLEKLHADWEMRYPDNRKQRQPHDREQKQADSSKRRTHGRSPVPRAGQRPEKSETEDA